MIEFLLERGADPNCDSNAIIPPPLILAIDYGKMDLFQLLLKYNANVNVKDLNGWSALHLCAEKGNVEML